VVFLRDAVGFEGLYDVGAERKAVASGLCSLRSCLMYVGVVRME